MWILPLNSVVNWFKPLICLHWYPLDNHEVALSHSHVSCKHIRTRVRLFIHKKLWKTQSSTLFPTVQRAFWHDVHLHRVCVFDTVKWHRTLNHLRSTIITNWLHLFWWTRWSQRFRSAAWRTRLTITQASVLAASDHKSCPFSQIGGWKRGSVGHHKDTTVTYPVVQTPP